MDDFQRLYPDAGTKKAAKGLTGPDIAGIGLQLFGAAQQAGAEEEESRRQQERDRLAMVLSGRQERIEAQQFAQTSDQNERSLNMRGAELLAEQRANALKNRRMYSTRKAFDGAF